MPGHSTSNLLPLPPPARPATDFVGRSIGALPHLGLVCATSGPRCRYRSVAPARLHKLSANEQQDLLYRLYWENAQRLNWTLSFCASRGIRLYRVTSSLFPMSDQPMGREILDSISANLSAIGRRAAHLGIRIVAQADRCVVLNGRNDATTRASVSGLQRQALWFDLMGLPQSTWSAIVIRGGKANRDEHLIRAVLQLPESVRSRLCLANDEHSYSAEQILDVCRHTRVPMIFDNLAHAISQHLDSYVDPSFERFTKLARDTWPDPRWQIVQLSNGRDGFRDRHHSDLITEMPPAFRRVQWIEVEARGKERAIADLSAKLFS